MKKILLAIFGAALLMVGCTKEIETAVNDINSRLTALETQVAANKAAIEELQKANFITEVKETETGWTITLSNNKVITLYNGAQGAQGAQGPQGPQGPQGEKGDAFFSSVKVEGEVVIITLSDGTVFNVPFAVEFGLELIADEMTVKPNDVTAIPYRLTGATADTKVYAIVGGVYSAEINEATQEVLISAPAALADNSLLVIADRGDGKVSVKSLNIVGQVLTVGTIDRAAYFWSDAFNIPVVANVTVKFSTDVNWLTITGSKAPESYTVSVKVDPTPSCIARTGNIFVKDLDGNLVQTIVVSQGGRPNFYLNNQNSYATWAAASEALATATKDGKAIMNDGSVTVLVSQDADLDRIVLPANENITSLVIKAQTLGNADPAKTFIKGVTVPVGIPTTITNITIRPDGNQKIDGINPGYGVGVAIFNGANTVTMDNVIFDGTNADYKGTTPTMIFDKGSTEGSVLTVKNCKADFGGCRGAQLYGAGKWTFDNNFLSNSYSSYMMRLYATVDVTLTNNIFDHGDNLVNLYVFGPKVTPAIEADTSGKLTSEDSNKYSEKVKRLYTGKTGYAKNDKEEVVKTENGEASIYPGSKMAGKVIFNGLGYPTVTAALAAAGNEGVITIQEGEIDDNIKIGPNANITIQAADGADPAKVIINGSVEVAGSLTMKDVTLKTKDGLTTYVLGVSSSSDGYAWGHAYLARVENGAHDVTFENVHFVAVAGSYVNAQNQTVAFKDAVSELFIAQSKNVKVLNCVFDCDPDAAYCPNQTYDSEVEFRGNVFNTGGKKNWGLRIAAASKVVIAKNEFYTKYAVDLYDTFSGTLIMGDGVADDNYYGLAVEDAILSTKSRVDRVFDGCVIKPSTLIFNAPTTTGARNVKLAPVWVHMDDATWAANVDKLADVRNMAMNANGMYLAEAGKGDCAIYTLSLEDGSVVKTDVMAVADGLFHLDGMASLEDGTILISNMANAAATNFAIYAYDGSKLDTLAKWANAAIDGVVPRIGDMITASGTADNAQVIALDYQPSSARVFTFGVKKGEKKDKYTAMAYITGGFEAAPHIGTLSLYKDNKYYTSYDGNNPDRFIEITGAGWGGKTLGQITLGDFTSKLSRGAKFFDVDGAEYMAVLEMTNYNGTNAKGAKVRVYAVPTGDLVADLNGATAVATYDFPSDTQNGNSCANLDVIKKDGKIFIGVALRSTGAALLEFKY